MNMITILFKINDFDSLDCDSFHSCQHVLNPNKHYSSIYYFPARNTPISIAPDIISIMPGRTDSIIICISQYYNP